MNHVSAGLGAYYTEFPIVQWMSLQSVQACLFEAPDLEIQFVWLFMCVLHNT